MKRSSQTTKHHGSKKTTIIVAALIALSIGLGLFRLGAESFSDAEFASIGVLPQAVSGFAPLYHILMGAWVGAIGTSEFATRLPAVVFGALSVLGMFLLGKKLHDERTGLLSAALLATSQFLVLAQQEAQGYTLLLAATVFSSLAFMRLLEKPTILRAAVYALLAIFAVNIHFFAWFILLAHIILGMARMHAWRIAWKWHAIALLLAIVSVLPWASKVMASGVKAHPGSLIELFAKFFGYAWSVQVAGIVLIIALLAYLFLVIWRSDDRPHALAQEALTLLLIFAVPLTVFLFAQSAPLWMPSALIIVLPGFVLLLSRSILALPGKAISIAIAVLLIIQLVAVGAAYSGIGNPQLREGAAYLSGTQGPIIAHAFDPVRLTHYRAELAITPIERTTPGEAPSEALSTLANGSSSIVAVYHEGAQDLTPVPGGYLGAQLSAINPSLTLTKSTSLRGLLIEEYGLSQQTMPVEDTQPAPAPKALPVDLKVNTVITGNATQDELDTLLGPQPGEPQIVPLQFFAVSQPIYNLELNFKDVNDTAFALINPEPGQYVLAIDVKATAPLPAKLYINANKAYSIASVDSRPGEWQTLYVKMGEVKLDKVMTLHFTYFQDKSITNASGTFDREMWVRNVRIIKRS